MEHLILHFLFNAFPSKQHRHFFRGLCSRRYSVHTFWHFLFSINWLILLQDSCCNCLILSSPFLPASLDIELSVPQLIHEFGLTESCHSLLSALLEQLLSHSMQLCQHGLHTVDPNTLQALLGLLVTVSGGGNDTVVS